MRPTVRRAADASDTATATATAAAAATAASSATPSGKTPLHLAAWKGPLQNVQELIQRGAGVNKFSTSPGNYGKTAIFYAITRSRDELVLELLRHGAHVKIVNNKGQTPVSLAASHLKVRLLAFP